MLRRRLLAISVGLTLVAGCSGGSDEPSAAVVETTAPTVETTVPTVEPTTQPASPPTSGGGGSDLIALPDAVGMDLQAAQDTMQAAGFYILESHDATGQDRFQVLDRNWTVCDQSPPGGTPASPGTGIDFGAVKDEESCP